MQIKLIIQKVNLFSIVDGTTVVARITIDDSLEYTQQEDIESLKEGIGSLYQVGPEDVQTELEYQTELLHMAVILAGLAKQTFEKSSQQGGGTHELKEQAIMNGLATKAHENVLTKIKKIKKLEKNYDKQGFWRKK